MVERRMNGFDNKDEQKEVGEELADQDIEPPPPPAPEPTEQAIGAEESSMEDPPPPPPPPASINNETVNKFDDEFVKLETAKESYA